MSNATAPQQDETRDDIDEQPNTKQYVWLIRYGRTYPGLIENVGNYDSDLHYPEGFHHAEAMGNRLLESDQTRPHQVYTDPFLRCARTAHCLVTKLNNNDDNEKEVSIRIEEGLTEWQVPSLLVKKDSGDHTSPRTVKQLQEELSKKNDDNENTLPHYIDTSYRSINPQGPPRNNNDYTESNNSPEEDEEDDDNDLRPRYPETEEQLHRRCRRTLESILKNNSQERNIAIISHAPCVQSMAMALEGVTSPENSRIVGPWSLGGMTLFSRDYNSSEEGKWTLEFFSDTSHMPEKGEGGCNYHNGYGKWSLPSFEMNMKKKNKNKKEGYFFGKKMIMFLKNAMYA